MSAIFYFLWILWIFLAAGIISSDYDYHCAKVPCIVIFHRRSLDFLFQKLNNRMYGYGVTWYEVIVGHKWNVFSEIKMQLFSLCVIHGVQNVFYLTTFYMKLVTWNREYLKKSNIRRTFVGNKIVDYSDVVGASPVGAAPITSSLT